MACETSTEAWEKLKVEFDRCDRVEKEGETVKEYSAKIVEIVNK